MKLDDAKLKEIERKVQRNDNATFSFQSRQVNIGLICTAVVGIGVLVGFYYDPTVVQFKDFLTTILVGFACTTLLYTAKTFEHNHNVNIYRIHLDATKADRDAESSRSQNEYKSKLFAFEIMSGWHSAEMILHATRVRIFLEACKNDNIAKLLDSEEHEESRQSVMVLLNYFERIGLACQTKMADSTLLKSYFRGLFENYFANLEPYIRGKRNVKNNHKLFEQYELTIIEWRK